MVVVPVVPAVLRLDWLILLFILGAICIGWSVLILLLLLFRGWLLLLLLILEDVDWGDASNEEVSLCLRIVRCDDVDLITLSSFNEDDEEDDVNIFLNGMW